MLISKISILATCILLVFFANVSADIPRLITYQGQLADDSGVPVADGDYLLIFTIYDDSTAGTARWTELQTVSVNDGLFNVQLGTLAALPTMLFAEYPDLFLTMSVSGGPALAPRIRLTSSAFSFHALSVADDAVTADKIADGTIALADLGQNGAAEGQVIVWKTGLWGLTELQGGDITSVTAGDGLTGGGTGGPVALNVGSGPGINVSTNAVELDHSYTDDLYVNESGDIMTGILFFDHGADGTNEITISPAEPAIVGYHTDKQLLFCLQNDKYGSYGRLDLYSRAPAVGGIKTAIFGSSWGEINLFDEDGDETVSLEADDNDGGRLRLRQEDGTAGMNIYGGSTTDGSRLYMYDPGGTIRISFDSDLTGDGAVQLPAGSVASEEIIDETGIAAHYNMDLNSFSTDHMFDLDTVSITIPRAGYIVVEGRCIGSTAGTSAANFGLIQIDETAGGDEEFPHYTTFGASLDGVVATRSFPVYVSRIYFKPAGTYEFRMEGKQSDDSDGGYLITQNHMTLARYYPTSYGDIITAVTTAEADEFDHAVPETITRSNVDGSTVTETMYRVDLRDLELKAIRARAEAERLERELLEAQLAREREDGIRNGGAGK